MVRNRGKLIQHQLQRLQMQSRIEWQWVPRYSRRARTRPRIIMANLRTEVRWPQIRGIPRRMLKQVTMTRKSEGESRGIYSGMLR